MMRLCVPAYRKIDLTKVFWTLSLSLDLLVFIISLGLCLNHYGFDEGYFVAKKQFDNSVNTLGLVDFGPSAYEFFGDKYQYIVWLLAVFLIGKLVEAYSIFVILKPKVISSLLCISSLSFSLYQLWQLLHWKSKLLGEMDWTESYSRILRQSISLDWICFYSMLMLLIIQIVLSFFFYSKRGIYEISQN